MAIQLGDDGTMDTVVYCDQCGKEYRFNFDPCFDNVDPNYYDTFVQECLDGIQAEHVCGGEEDL